MKNMSPMVDAYIEKSAPFARPILEKVRRAFHKGCPQITETIKWGVPHFEYKGLVGGMAAFKQHVSFGFWKSKEMADPQGLFNHNPKASMCSVKSRAVADLPSENVLVAYVREAVRLNEQPRSKPAGVKRTPKDPRSLAVPDYFMKALKKNKKALATFNSFSFSNRKDYVAWVTGAKQKATRDKRLATAVEWMAEGKPHNWKYMKGRC